MNNFKKLIRKIKFWFLWIFIAKRLVRKMEQADRDIGIYND